MTYNNGYQQGLTKASLALLVLRLCACYRPRYISKE